MFGGFQNLISAFLLHFKIIWIMVCKIDHTDDPVHWCTDIMTHVWQKPGFKSCIFFRFRHLIQKRCFPFLCRTDTSDRTEHMCQISICVPLFFNKTKFMPVSILHPVFHGNGFFILHSFRQRRNICKFKKCLLIFLRNILSVYFFIIDWQNTGVYKIQLFFIFVWNFFKPVRLDINSWYILICFCNGRYDLVSQFRFLQCFLQSFLCRFFLIKNTVYTAIS